MENRTIRIRLKEDTFHKFKVFCALENISLTDQTNKIIKNYVEETEKKIKIIKIENPLA